MLRYSNQRAFEAENALRKAMALAQETRFCAPVHFLAELLVHRGEEAAARETIANWFGGAAPCYCCAVLEGDIAARSGNVDGARTAYRDALKLREDGVHALTGLSRFVDRAEGEKLIARAMAADPTDHRCLLARARLRQDDAVSQMADAVEAVRPSPAYAEAHLFLTRILLKQGDAERALEHLELSLRELPQQRELTAMLVDATMTIAAASLGEKVSAMLAKDEYGSTMEPLMVALQLKRGDSPNVAKEVLDIAGNKAPAVTRAPTT